MNTTKETLIDNTLTVGELIEKLNFGLLNGYITKDHKICVGNNTDTYYVENIALPAMVLENKNFKQVQMLFTKCDCIFDKPITWEGYLEYYVCSKCGRKAPEIKT